MASHTITDTCGYTFHPNKVQSARLGTTSFKFGLKSTMSAMYPLNNVGDQAWPANPASLAELVKAPQLQRLLRNDLGTNFESITLWAYRVGAPDAPFCDHNALPIPPSELAAETAEMAALTVALMSTPASSSTTSFWIESWENDWATRCGSYAPDQPPPAPVREAFTAWLRARQAGVEKGREAFCNTQMMETIDCSDQASIVAAARINVYLGAEVNLVGNCLTNRVLATLFFFSLCLDFEVGVSVVPSLHRPTSTPTSPHSLTQ